jgi:hypothetical protein
VPAEAVSLALAASIYPPALAAVIALGRGEEVRLRVVLLVLAAYVTVFATGTLILILFNEAGATGRGLRTPPAGLYVLAGVLLLGLAARLRKPRAPKERAPGPSRTDRYLQSRRLVVLLGVILYIVPSPIYVGAIKELADQQKSTAQELAQLAPLVVIMLWLIELPMVMLIAFPRRGVGLLEAINAWFVAHGRALAVFAAGAVGVYLIIVGLIEIL